MDSPMQIKFIHDEQTFHALAGDWDRLLENSVTRVPFLLHAFQRTWWSTRGGGEWPTAELFLALGQEDDGEVSAIAPLFLARQADGEKALMLLGSVEIADVLDFIAAEGELAGFIPALLEALESVEGWDRLELSNLLEGTPTRAVVREAARARGWSTEDIQLQPAPYVTLGTSWETYLEALDSKQRRELKRKLRRADSYPVSVDWRLVDSGADLHDEIDAFLRLMAMDSQKENFLTESMRRHFHLLAEAAAAEGWLQLAVLDVAGEPAFGYFNFDFNGKLWIYNSGFNPNHASLSPGWVLMGHLIQWAIEQGRHEIDFLRGDEEYKYRLGGVDRFVTRLTVRR
ncbi:MAG: GNAT family N-acetyltransferase [Anaerolineales bacterium]